VKTAIGTNEALFEGGSFVEYPAQSTNVVRLKMLKEKNTEETVSVKVLISQGANAPHFLIHEETLILSKFSFFIPAENAIESGIDLVVNKDNDG